MASRADKNRSWRVGCRGRRSRSTLPRAGVESGSADCENAQTSPWSHCGVGFPGRPAGTSHQSHPTYPPRAPDDRGLWAPSPKLAVGEEHRVGMLTPGQPVPTPGRLAASDWESPPGTGCNALPSHRRRASLELFYERSLRFRLDGCSAVAVPHPANSLHRSHARHDRQTTEGRAGPAVATEAADLHTPPVTSAAENVLESALDHRQRRWHPRSGQSS